MADAIKPSACVVVFGVRFLSAGRIDEEEDPRATAAKRHGLDVECGRRYPAPEGDEPTYFLLIGKCLHEVAFDGSCERSADPAEVLKAAETTAAKLAAAGFVETPELWVQCRFD